MQSSVAYLGAWQPPPNSPRPTSLVGHFRMHNTNGPCVNMRLILEDQGRASPHMGICGSDPLSEAATPWHNVMHQSRSGAQHPLKQRPSSGRCTACDAAPNATVGVSRSISFLIINHKRFFDDPPEPRALFFLLPFSSSLIPVRQTISYLIFYSRPIRFRSFSDHSP